MTQELIITDIEVGSGKTAVKGALITTRYSGRLADGCISVCHWYRQSH